MERSVNDGLVALATSDLFLCLVYFIASLYWNKLVLEQVRGGGLVALATSDLFLCLVYFIASLYWNKLVLEQARGGGLVALATSDLFLCLVYFIASLYWNKLNYDSLVELYYRTYEESFINFFLLARYDH